MPARDGLSSGGDTAGDGKETDESASDTFSLPDPFNTGAGA